MSSFIHDDTPTEQVDAREQVLAGFTATVRDLVDATIRTTVGDEELHDVQRELQHLVARLRSSQLPGPAGVRYNSGLRAWNWGNAVIGAANAIAPPLRVVRGDDGLHVADVVLGAAYEGPPGLVHGGVSAMLLDHIMGETASSSHRVTFTGTLTTRYRRGTPLGPLHLEARITGEEGRKVFVSGSISDGEGVCVEADGTFIEPRWATEGRLIR